MRLSTSEILKIGNMIDAGTLTEGNLVHMNALDEIDFLSINGYVTVRSLVGVYYNPKSNNFVNERRFWVGSRELTFKGMINHFKLNRS